MREERKFRLVGTKGLRFLLTYANWNWLWANQKSESFDPGDPLSPDENIFALALCPRLEALVGLLEDELRRIRIEEHAHAQQRDQQRF